MIDFVTEFVHEISDMPFYQQQDALCWYFQPPDYRYETKDTYPDILHPAIRQWCHTNSVRMSELITAVKKSHNKEET